MREAEAFKNIVPWKVEVMRQLEPVSFECKACGEKTIAEVSELDPFGAPPGWFSKPKDPAIASRTPGRHIERYFWCSLKCVVDI